MEAQKRAATLTVRTTDLINAMRRTLNEAGEASRKMLLVVDGSFTNSQVIRGLPHDTDLIGRTRKNAKLSAPLKEKDGKRIYGPDLGDPEQIRQDAAVPSRPCA